jgi:hypothetical protein
VNGLRRRLTFLVGACAALVAAASPASAQRTHVLIIEGLSGEPAYKHAFDSVATILRTGAKARWNVVDSSMIVLSEDSVASTPSRGRSTKEGVAAAFTTLSRRVQPGDVLLVVILGHGSGEGAGSKVNLPGPDPTAADYAAWISGFARETVVFVNAASGSGDFLSVLAGTGRVIVTSTKSALERNESIFAQYFAAGLTSDAADADKDGRVSVLEAFRYATREVARAYESTKRMQTEHAQLSDSLLARSVAFGGAASSTDPRVLALVAERQALEADVAALRTRKATTEAAAYEKELERLLIAIAEKTQAIKAAGGGK